MNMEYEKIMYQITERVDRLRKEQTTSNNLGERSRCQNISCELKGIDFVKRLLEKD